MENKNKIKKWIVNNNFCYRVNKDLSHRPGEIFEATEEQVQSQAWKVRLFREPKTEPIENIDKPVARKRGRPPRKTTVVAEAPLDRAM